MKHGTMMAVAAMRVVVAWVFLLLLPAAVQAQYTYSTNSGAITITGYTGGGGALTITNTINGLPVTSIGDYAFYGSANLTTVTIPNGVTSIGELAFVACTNLTAITVDASNVVYSSIAGVLFDKNQTRLIECPEGIVGGYTIPASVTNIGGFAFVQCTGLTNITIPNGVTVIESNAFYECTGLTSITFPNSITSIGYLSFPYCTGLTNITIPNSVNNIGWRAFLGCSGLTTVTIPQSVTNIGAEAFNSCTSLTNITVDPNNPAYSSAAGVLFDKHQTTLILYPDGKVGSSFMIPTSVTSIGDESFELCTMLTQVTIPNSVTNIGDSAFYQCTSLASVTIGNNVTSIGSYAFNFCTSLSSVTIPSSVTSIGDGAFYWCTNLTSVTIPNSVTNIGDSAFYQCTSLASVTIGNNVTSIGDSAFNSCTSLTNITVDPINSVYCSVNGVLFDKSQRTLIQYPVGKAGTSYTVPASVTSIGEATFDGCTNLTGVTIPASVTNIGSYAFMWCTSLTGVYFQGNAPSVTNETTVFFPDPTTVYYLPCATGWGTAFDGRPTALWTGYPNVTVTVTANPSQGGSATGTGTYPVCSNVQISASASNGWIFTGWGDGSTNAIRTIPVPATNITYTADFLQQTGSVQVTISPAGAVTAGAQWKVDGGAWQNSGVTMSGVTVGSHTLHFNTITGWTTPADQSLTISNGLTTTATGYVQQFGSVQVTISPASAVTAGAQWQVDGGAWENSGVTMPGLTVGSHMLHFNTMMGWTTPANQSVTVNNSSTTTVTCAYVQQIGSVQVTISPAGAVTAGAQWQVDGGAWQNSGATVSSLSNGSHTVYFNTVTGWDSPVNQVIRISTGLTTPVTGTYTPIPCIYSISAPGSTVWCGSGSWSFNLTTSNWCSWAAVGNAGWITITSGSSGTGNGTVSGTYAANSNTSTRTGYISVGGQTFAVTQAGLTTATISVQANPANAGTMSGGGKYNVGSSQQISATAINTWVFVGWDDGDTNATRTIIVPVSGRTYTAFFDWASPLDSVKFTETYQDKIACDANKNCGTYPTGAFTINAVLFTGAGLAATNLNKTTPVEISIGGWSYQGKTGTLGDDPQYKAKAIKANLPLMYQDRTGKTKSAGTAILGFGRTNVTLTITVTAGQDAQHNTVQHMIDADQLTGNAFLGNTVVSNKISATFTIGDYLEFFTNIVVTGTVTAKNSQAKDGIHQVDTVKIKGASHR